MTLLSPLGALLAAALAIPALLLLYYLKLRRQPRTVSSTLLWQKAIDDLQVNAPFQKLRRNLLLLLQLLVLLALIAALARPALRGQDFRGRRVVILVDQSASMNARDGSGETRLEQARQHAIDLVNQLDGASAMVVSFARSARVVQPFTSDARLLRQAIRSIEPTDASGSLTMAAQLIEPFARAPEGQEPAAGQVAIVLLSDGRLGNPDLLQFPGATMQAQIIGGREGDSRNVGIVALSARRDLTEPATMQVFAELASTLPMEHEAAVSLLVDGAFQQMLSVTLPPATAESPGRKAVQFAITLSGGGLLTLALNEEDDLASDDRASLVLTPPHPLRVLLVSNGNPFLRKAIEAAGVERLTPVTLEAYRQADPAALYAAGDDDGGFDVAVFDGYSPEQVPPVPSLYFRGAPPSLAVRFEPLAAVSEQVALDWDYRHPALRDTQLDSLVALQDHRLVLGEEASLLAAGPYGPLMAQLDLSGRRQFIVSFDLLQSNWPMQVSFPIFISSVLQWLGPAGGSGAGIGYQPGDLASVPVARGERVVYRGPESLEAEVKGGIASLPAFRLAGVYQITSPQNQPEDRLAVSVLDLQETDIRPVVWEPAADSAGASIADTSTNFRRELWPWAIAAALAVLMVEWLVYTRKMHL